MQRCSRSLRVLFLSFVTLGLLLGSMGSALAESAGKIAFLPFKANAPKDMGYLTNGIRDMLASRLASEVGLTVLDKNNVDAALPKTGSLTKPQDFLNLGKKLGADYVVAGSLTAFGASLSLDAKIYDTAKGSHQNFYATAKSESEIIPAIDTLAWDIGEKTFGHKRPVTALRQPQAAPTAPAAPQSAYTTAHPERTFAQRSGAYGGSPFVYAKGATSGFTKSQNMKLTLQYMEVADLDGDGVDEFILANRTSVQIFKRNGPRLAKVGQIEAPARYKVHAISVADLNGNGKMEIYVSAADHLEPRSFAFEWQEKNKATYLFQNERFFVRAMHLPGESTVLLGQQPDFDNPIRPGIFRLEKKGKTLKAGNRVQLPESVNLFDFTVADLDNDGSREVIAIDQHDRLKVMRTAGTLLWESDDFYGGTTRYIGGIAPKNVASAVQHKEDYGRIYIPSRIIVADVNLDGQKDILVNKNLSTSSRVFQNMKNYPSGEVHALTWNGIGLEEMWRTKKIDGYITDYMLLLQGEDETKAELAVGLILRRGDMSMAGEKTSTVLFYQLDFNKTAKIIEENMERNF